MKRHLSGRLTQTPYNYACSFSILPGRIISRLYTLIGDRDDFDFYICSFGERRDLDSGTSRGILLEIRTINFVNGLEIGEVRKEDRCLNDMVES